MDQKQQEDERIRVSLESKEDGRPVSFLERRIIKMKKKKVSGILAALVLSLCGCGVTETAEVAEQMKQQEALPSVEIEDTGKRDQESESVITDEMYERATAFLEGDLTRLAAVLRRAEQGEDMVIGVIGGSITEQYSASSYANCYASLVEQWWRKRFPDAKLTFVNAGIGGTNSYLGVHRVEEDLLSKEPDLVIVEFSVNDGNNAFFKKSYDNLVRRILTDEKEPAVMLLFTTQEDGTNAQENDSLIGFRYHLPMISYGNAVLPEIEAGNLAWKDISPDNVHPNDRGHAILAELITRYLEEVAARLDEIDMNITPFAEKALSVQSYQHAIRLDAETLEPLEYGSFEKKAVNNYFKNNWHTSGGEEAIVFEVEAANIGIVYQRTTDGTYGQFDVYIDDVLVETLDGNFENGWGTSTEAVELYASDEITQHKIRIVKNEDSTGDFFTIVSLLIS